MNVFTVQQVARITYIVGVTKASIEKERERKERDIITIEASAIKLLTSVINAAVRHACMLTNARHFHPSLTFVGKAGNLPLHYSII